jgi:DNA (cytosine-5)-methyltransferase 1
MKLISLFSGIGGFELAAEWMGWEPVASCEINEFGRKVLSHYWPNAWHHDDVHTFTFERLNYELTKRHGAEWSADELILTGGFPCQPYSSAGKRLGKEDERHLWPEMLRAIREISPRWVVGENVRGLTNWNGGLVFDEVQADLEAEGYEVLPFLLPACAVNAPHRRDRIWFIANRNVANPTNQRPRKLRNKSKKAGAREGDKLFGSQCGVANQSGDATNAERLRLQQRQDTKEMGGPQTKICGKGNQPANAIETDGAFENATNTNSTPSQRRNGQAQKKRQKQSGRIKSFSEHTGWEVFPTQPPVCGGDDGLPTELDGITFPKWRNESIKAYGNAIVPQVAYQIFQAIEAYRNEK